MRELVYLSERKLRQFDLQRRRWPGRGRVEGEVKIPGVGGLKVGPGPGEPPAADLDAVLAALDSSDRAAKWFADDGARPGDWVQFEAPMSYTCAWFAAVFVDLDQATDSYPTGGAIRLLLHGSEQHLAGAQSGRGNYDAAAGYLPEPTGSDLLRVVTLLKRLPDDTGQSLFTEAGDDPLSEKFGRVVDALSERLAVRHTGAWMGGYARVTGVLGHTAERRIVTATPLYVEYLSEPG
ncbi:SAVMC3_10250 family protein [Amycolatopsis sp. VS8301801F10]|uniref:SAVMC3_10250 family protein n=1 Tax=Amycolatopsis sp. VS8301801F10 TaxID=2652442 RepID=UPI0038FC4B64